jgi:hypothetical protein
MGRKKKRMKAKLSKINFSITVKMKCAPGDPESHPKNHVVLENAV